MTIPPIPPVGDLSAVGASVAAQRPADKGFAAAFQRGLAEVSAMEHRADAVAMDVATGGESQVHDLMVATSQSQISMDLLLAVRNRAVEAYQEIMRLPV
jgi:flagellar hook-basal body complex protein FliE